jgi:hypothetical protein
LDQVGGKDRMSGIKGQFFLLVWNQAFFKNFAFFVWLFAESPQKFSKLPIFPCIAFSKNRPNGIRKILLPAAA